MLKWRPPLLTLQKKKKKNDGQERKQYIPLKDISKGT
jgi:hypothetical protein